MLLKGDVGGSWSSDQNGGAEVSDTLLDDTYLGTSTIQLFKLLFAALEKHWPAEESSRQMNESRNASYRHKRSCFAFRVHLLVTFHVKSSMMQRLWWRTPEDSDPGKQKDHRRSPSDRKTSLIT